MVLPAITRLLRQTPASTRAYSSFFSSKSGGGGRYFNSAKQPKVVVTNNAAAKAKTNTVKPDPGSEAPVDGSKTPGGNIASGKANANSLINAGADQSSTAPPHSSSSSSSSSSSIPALDGTNTDTLNLNARFTGNPEQFHRQLHPVVNAKDFKLHQFFSVHRPLLLLAHPTSIMDSAPQGVSFIPSEAPAADESTRGSPYLLDEFAEATPDADAAAARQLTRALTMHHAGAAVAWEDTLRRLGLDVDKEADRVGLQQQWDKDWQEVMMDSVKRKRRSKMKKHKLKKRRKATRAHRLKIGR